MNTHSGAALPVPELTVAAVAADRGRFLVVEERIKGKLVINQPAGHVEPGETLLQAVAREALEESAWRFRPEAIVGIYLWQTPDQRQCFLRIAFCGSCEQQEPQRTLDTGIERALWLSRDELLHRASMLRSPMVLRCIDDYQNGSRLPFALAQTLDMAQLASHAVRL